MYCIHVFEHCLFRHLAAVSTAVGHGGSNAQMWPRYYVTYMHILHTSCTDCNVARCLQLGAIQNQHLQYVSRIKITFVCIYACHHLIAYSAIQLLNVPVFLSLTYLHVLRHVLVDSGQLIAWLVFIALSLVFIGSAMAGVDIVFLEPSLETYPWLT